MITYDHIDQNKRASLLLIAVFIGVLSAVGYVFARTYGNPLILVGVVIFSLVSTFVSYYFADSITLALSGAKQVTAQEAPDLYRIVENLSITAGLPMPKVYVIDDSAMNAFATGRDPEHAVVCATTGILARLEKPELEGVIAHELSHIGNYDIRLMALVAVLAGTLTLLSDWFLHASFFGGGRRDDRDSGSGQGGQLIMIVGIVLIILSPVIATLIKLAVSRKREYLADASGALLTRYPEGLARALEKISQDTEPLEAANKATAHMYFANPMHADSGKRSAGWLASLFNTHPPIEDRIQRLRNMNL